MKEIIKEQNLEIERNKVQSQHLYKQIDALKSQIEKGTESTQNRKFIAQNGSCARNDHQKQSPATQRNEFVMDYHELECNREDCNS